METKLKRTYSRQEKDLVFDLWKRGAGFNDIARVLDEQPESIFTVLRKHGGIKPAHRKRSSTHLTTAEREEIRVCVVVQLPNA